LADKEVTVVSVNDSISINAKTKIVLKAGQTSITLEGANITFACPGTFSVKGAAHFLDGGASTPAALAKLPDSRVKLYDEQFALLDPAGKPLLNIPFIVNSSDGKEMGQTPADGKTSRVGTESAEMIKFEVRWHELES
jgi:type VI secretion system secreted protein VgrG